jgi:hypothetical protein
MIDLACRALTSIQRARICILLTLGCTNAFAANLPPPDINRDGMVNFGDLSIMSRTFYTSSPRSDLNVDGSVNFSDLAILKAYFFVLWPPISPTTLRWLPPTTTETGEPLPPDAITSWQVQIDDGAPITVPLGDTTTVVVDGVTYTQWETTVSGRGVWSYCVRAVVGTQASECSEGAVKRVEP